EWNFTIEQQLDRNTSLRVAYVGSFGYHQFVSLDPNSIPAQICSNPAGCTAGGTTSAGNPVPAALQSHVPQGAQYIPVGSRPNPFVSNGFFWYSEGNASYNSLQIDVNRRLTRGFQMRANYTWSKNLDHNSALTIAQANNQPQMIMDRNDLRRDWGPSALDVTHQASISAHYELPFGKGQRRAGPQPEDRRLAAQRNYDASERIPLHAADGLEPLRQRRHAESRPAEPESGVYRSCGDRESKPVV